MPLAVLLAGGNGTRMGALVPKQFLLLSGKEIWAHTVQAFQDTPCIDAIILVCRKDFREHMAAGVLEHGFSKVAGIVEGGSERYLSALNGIMSCDCAPDEKVLILDAVRPCIPMRVIEDVLLLLDRFDACDTGLPVVETLFEAENGRIAAIPERSRFYSGQGPEGFRYGVVRKALAQYAESGGTSMTNISGIVHRCFPDMPIGLALGSERNIKITTPRDLLFAEQLLQSRDVGPI
jgi:4-diphosphocytidyl-2-methyl-D-erithritol synthase